MAGRKRLEITDNMLDQIQRVTDTVISASDIVVYEAAALSTLPLTKKGSIYHGARASRELLLDMARGVRSGEHSVPLHTLHLQGAELPVGRVFDADVLDEPDGSSTLLARFYIPISEDDLISKIDMAVLDEVSVGMKPKMALCSSCGFDYFAEDADIMHLWDQTCPDGHTIDVDGVHLQLKGLDGWVELSLVSRGASARPKIRSKIRETLAPTVYDRIAASGMPVEAVLLIAQTPMEKDLIMDADVKAAFEALTAKVDDLVARLNETPAQVELSDEEILNLSVEGLKISDLKAQLEEAQAKIAEAQAEAQAEAEAEAEAEAQAEAAPEQRELDLPTGGVAASAVTDAKVDHHLVAASAFKTTKPKRR